MIAVHRLLRVPVTAGVYIAGGAAGVAEPQDRDQHRDADPAHDDPETGADERVQQVVSADAEVLGDVINVSVEAQPIVGRSVSVDATT